MAQRAWLSARELLSWASTLELRIQSGRDNFHHTAMMISSMLGG